MFWGERRKLYFLKLIRYSENTFLKFTSVCAVSNLTQKGSVPNQSLNFHLVSSRWENNILKVIWVGFGDSAEARVGAAETMAGGKAGKGSGKAKGKAVSRSQTAGLQFTMGCIYRHLKDSHHKPLKGWCYCCIIRCCDSGVPHWGVEASR